MEKPYRIGGRRCQAAPPVVGRVVGRARGWKHLAVAKSTFPELGDQFEELAQAAFHSLDDSQFARAIAYGRPEQVRAGDLVFDIGGEDADLFLVESGSIEVRQVSGDDDPFLSAGPRQFVGELNLLTGQTRILQARVITGGVVHRVAPEEFRRLMAQDAELSDLLLRSFLARRQLLVRRAGQDLQIVADQTTGTGLALRTFLIRQDLPYHWAEQSSPAGKAAAVAAGLTDADLPAAIIPRGTIRNVEPRSLSHRLGLTYRRTPNGVADLTIVGAGPAGLAAAVYGASEGLETIWPARARSRRCGRARAASTRSRWSTAPRSVRGR